jgi:hypothetical protein
VLPSKYFQNLRLGGINVQLTVQGRDYRGGEQTKVALSALGKRRMKNVDKNIDKRNKQGFGSETAQ